MSSPKRMYALAHPSYRPEAGPLWRKQGRHVATELTIGIIAMSALILGPATAANADHDSGDRGDQTTNCVYTEICFSEHTGGDGGLRHFYNRADHAHAGNFNNGVVFYHNASAIRNRDSELSVCVLESGDIINDRWTFVNGATSYISFAYDLTDENAHHSRGAC